MELLEHLRECPHCAGLAKAEASLTRDLELASQDDTVDTLSFTAIKARVESRAELASPNTEKEYSIMAKLINNISRRPRFGISVGVALVLLAAVTLIPLKLSHTIGYEVAIAGVNKDLALDQDRVKELLGALGVQHAEFTVDGCEQTCHLTISELKDQYEVQMITTAFIEMGNCEIEKVIPISEQESGSLVEYAKNKVFFGKLKTSGNEELHQVVIEKLGQLQGDSTSQFTVWVSADSMGGNYEFEITSSDGMPGEIMIGHDMMPVVEGGKQLKVTTENGETIFEITDDEGNVHVINMNDPDAQEQLEELGMQFHMLQGADGSGIARFWSENVPGGQAGKIQTFEPVEKELPSNLPEGYALSQNYPNPFNPTTNIDFTLPQAQHVRIDIFNINGQKVRTLIDSYTDAGPHTVEWDSRDDGGNQVASGVYLYNFRSGDVNETKKMTLVK